MMNWERSIFELTRKIVQIFNYPSNMTFIIPNEYQGKEEEPVWAQYGYISSVSYGSTKQSSIRQNGLIVVKFWRFMIIGI